MRGGGGRRKGYGSSLGGLRPSPAPGPLTPQPLSRKMPVDYSSPRWHTGHLRRLWEPREVPRDGWGGGGERVKGDCCHSIRPLACQLSSNPRDPLRGRSKTGGTHACWAGAPSHPRLPGALLAGTSATARSAGMAWAASRHGALGLRLLLSGLCLCAAQVSCARV